MGFVPAIWIPVFLSGFALIGVADEVHPLPFVIMAGSMVGACVHAATIVLFSKIKSNRPKT